MTAEQQKAKELIDKYYPYAKMQSSGFLVSNEDFYIENAKQCSFICVDDEIKILQNLKNKLQSMALLDSTFEVMGLIDELQQVKHEIINYKN